MTWTLDRRTFLGALAAGSATLQVPRWARAQEPDAAAAWRARTWSVGRKIAVASSSREATEAALWALSEGGNAADAYLAAALTQTVVEPGLTTIGGALGLTYFGAAKGTTQSAVGLLGPAAAEPYDYERFSPVSRTGRAMPVPGFLAGCKLAHEHFGSLPWTKLFAPAIGYALSGVVVSDSIRGMAEKQAADSPEMRSIWTKDGRFLQPGEKLVQPGLGRTLQAVAKDGPEAFYEGDFARAYVKRSRADGGRLTMEDMKGWRDRARTRSCEIEGSYRGHQVCAPRAGLLTYALHLSEALDLRATGAAKSNPESVFRQVRILEEVFLSTKDYSEENHDRYVSPDYAKQRADFVLNSPLREVRIDDLFNTCFLVIRDEKGNCAWGTHSINTPQAFGAGIVVGGVVAAYAIDRDHVRGKGATAGGISTCYALYREGKPRLITGSPGFGFVHGPYQYGTAVTEWGLTAEEAAWAPRFGLPAQLGSTELRFERHYAPEIFAMLAEKKIPHSRIKASPATGLVGAILVDKEGRLHVTQDPRSGGLAKAI